MERTPSPSNSKTSIIILNLSDFPGGHIPERVQETLAVPLRMEILHRSVLPHRPQGSVNSQRAHAALDVKQFLQCPPGHGLPLRLRNRQLIDLHDGLVDKRRRPNSRI